MREPGAQQRMVVGERRRVARGHRHLVATEAVLRVAGHGHPLRCLSEESLRLAEPAAVSSLGEHRPDRSRVAGPQVVDAVVDPSLPAVAPPDRRVLDQVGQIDGEQDPALDRPPVEVVRDGSPEHALPLGIPASQVGVHRLAHQLVQRQPVAQRLGEAPGCEPFERLHRVGARKHVAEEVHGGHPRRGRHAERPSVGRVDLGVGQPADQGPDHGRALDGVVGVPSLGLAGGVRAEGEGEGRAVGPGDELRGDVGVDHAAGAQKVERLPLGQGTQLDAEHEALPPAFEPGPLRRAAAGDHHDRPGGKRAQQVAAQEGPQRGHPLVAVEQQQRLLVVPGSAQRELERVGHRRQLPALHEGRRPAAALTAPGQLAQQRALSDASRPVQEGHARARRRRRKARRRPPAGNPFPPSAGCRAATVACRASPPRS